MQKSIQLGIKDVDTKQGIVSGYFSRFNNKDADGDVILPGAFTASIAEHGPKSTSPRIKHLLDHDPRKAVAVLQHLEQDAYGLKYESKAGRHQNGQDFLLMAEDGIITEHSIGFNIKKYHVENDDDKKETTWFLEELKLWEGSSLQAWGANADTPITGVKELKITNVVERMELLEKAIKNGKYSDEAFLQLELELKQINTLLKSLNVDKRPEDTVLQSIDKPKAKKSTIFDDLLI